VSQHDEKIPIRKLLLKGIEGEEEETPEQAAERERKAAEWNADSEKRQREHEEAVRLAVPRDIERLRKEAAEKIAEADQLEHLLAQYPNIRKHTGRWNKVAYYTKDVNTLVNRFDMRHNCGCCNDSPLEVWPYLETPLGKVYSDPSMFRVGEKEPFYHGDRPLKGWDKQMRDAGIPEPIVGAIGMHFRREAQEAKELAASIYNEVEEEEEPI
jgi:hypothetical protein